MKILCMLISIITAITLAACQGQEREIPSPQEPVQSQEPEMPQLLNERQEPENAQAQQIPQGLEFSFEQHIQTMQEVFALREPQTFQDLLERPRQIPASVDYWYEFDQRVQDFRRGISVCSVHLTSMESQEVRISGGFINGGWFNYIAEVREIHFPNCDDIIEGFSNILLLACPPSTVIFVCDDCNADRDLWWAHNRDVWRVRHSWESTGFPPAQEQEPVIPL